MTDLVEEILVRLPLKSILKFKTVSKQWRSILESRSFTERRRMVKNKVQQILAAAENNQLCPMLLDEEGVQMFYLDCEVATRPSMACDGLVCIPEPGSINVLNPSTREFLRFSSLKPLRRDTCFDCFPVHWRMGFGRDKVNGSYKIVRMIFEPNHYAEILDLNIGEWRKLRSLPPYFVGQRSKSACVNGSIYWLPAVTTLYDYQKILALDLHTQEFRDVPTPPLFCKAGQLANLEDRLVLATINTTDHPQWNVEVWSMDAQEETWTITYSFPLIKYYSHNVAFWGYRHMRFTPVAVSKRGNLFIRNDSKELFIYYPKTGLFCCISDNISVISPVVENLLTFQRPASAPEFRIFHGFQYLNHESRISKLFRQIKMWIPNILITTVVAATILKTRRS